MISQKWIFDDICMEGLHPSVNKLEANKKEMQDNNLVKKRCSKKRRKKEKSSLSLSVEIQ